MKYCTECINNRVCTLNKSDANRKYNCTEYEKSLKLRIKEFWSKYADNCIKALR